MRREERVTVQGPVKEQQPDGMSHGGGGGGHGGRVKEGETGLSEVQRWLRSGHKACRTECF